MDLLIQGRKGGYNVLFPKPTPPFFFKFASDIQNASARNDSRFYGKTFFSVAFDDGGCIFSKYLIGADKSRGALGNIGFSIFVPKDRHLPGKDVKALLDDLVEGYEIKYLHDFTIPGELVEDWAIFANLASVCDSKLVIPEEIECFSPGTAAPAYLYYSSADELVRMLEYPYQREYCGYKQVFFLDSVFKSSPDNPLLCLKYDSAADLTGKVDINNIKLKLRFSDSQSGLHVTVEEASSGSYTRVAPNSRVRLNDVVRISWTRDCYERKSVEAPLRELISSGAYVTPDMDRNAVDIRTDVTLIPFRKAVRVTAVAAVNSALLPEARVAATNAVSHVRKNADAGILIFEGEETVQRWLVSAESGLLRSSDSDPVNTVYPSRTDSLTIRLHEEIELTIKAVDSKGNPVDDYTVYVPGYQAKTVTSGVVKYKFYDANISRRVEVSVIKRGTGGLNYEGRRSIVPAEQEIVEIPLHESLRAVSPILEKEYYIDAGRHGCIDPYKKRRTTKDPSGKDVMDIIIPNDGYEFTGYIVDGNSYNPVLYAQYRKKTWFKLLPWVAGAVLLSGLAVGCFFLFRNDNGGARQEGQQNAVENAQGHADGEANAADTCVTKDTVPENPQQPIKQDGNMVNGKTDVKQVDNGGNDEVKKTSSDSSGNSSTTASTASNESQGNNDADDSVNEIKEYLKGSVTTSTTNRYLKVNSMNDDSYKEIRSSLELVKEFFENLRNLNLESMSSLLSKVKKDKYLKNSELCVFLEKICKPDKFDKFKQISSLGSATNLQTLDDAFRRVE